MVIVLCFVFAIILMVVGVPVAFSFCLPVVFLYLLEGIDISMIPYTGFFNITSFTTLAIPFFIYLGDIMAAGGCVQPLVNVTKLLVGKMKYALAQVVVVVNVFFGAITGSGVAAVAATGGLLYPVLKAEGYDKNYCAALMASSGAIGFLIPPSIPLVVFASVVNGASVGDLFMGGIIPGLILAALFMIINHFKCRQTPPETIRDSEPVQSKPTPKKDSALSTILIAIPAFMLPVIILGGIYGGFFDSTSAAAIACIYAILVGLFIYKKLKLRTFINATKDSAVSIACIFVVMFILAGLSEIMVMMQVPQMLTITVTSLGLPRPVMLFVIAMLLVLFGMIMDAVSGMLVVAPLLSNLMTALEVSTTQFGIIMCVAFALGLVTPPVAANIYVAGKIADTPITKFLKDLVPFMIAFFIVLMLVTYIPAISCWLPSIGK